MNLKSMIILGLISMTLSSTCVAANDPVAFKEFYNKYKSEDGFISVNVPIGLIGLFVNSEDQDLNDLMDNIDDIHFLIYNGESRNGSQLAGELKDKLKPRWYRDFMIENEGDEKIEFKVRADRKLIHEVVMIVSSNDTFVVMSIVGEITPEQVKELSKSIDLDGINGLSRS